MTDTSSPRVRIRLPEPLRGFVGGAPLIEVSADSVDAALGRLAELSPQLRLRLFADDGNLREYVNVFVGPDEVRELQGLGTRLEEGAEVHIIPSIAGG